MATSKQVPASWPLRNQGLRRSLLRLGVDSMESLLLGRSWLHMASLCNALVMSWDDHGSYKTL